MESEALDLISVLSACRLAIALASLIHSTWCLLFRPATRHLVCFKRTNLITLDPRRQCYNIHYLKFESKAIYTRLMMSMSSNEVSQLEEKKRKHKNVCTVRGNVAQANITNYAVNVRPGIAAIWQGMKSFLIPPFSAGDTVKSNRALPAGPHLGKHQAKHQAKHRAKHPGDHLGKSIPSKPPARLPYKVVSFVAR